MDLVFDIIMFIFMVAIIFSQHYTITVCSKRINQLAKEVGVRYATEKNKTTLLNQKISNISNKGNKKGPIVQSGQGL